VAGKEESISFLCLCQLLKFRGSEIYHVFQFDQALILRPEALEP